jgi:signal transduction histidine kinase
MGGEMMDTPVLIGILIALAALLAAATAILFYRKRMKKTMEKLDAMLESAINGDFTETAFDESALSALETKMAQFLSASAVSSKNLSDEKDKIKSLISDISHQTKTPVANILLYAQLLGERELPEDSFDCVKALSAQAEKLNFLIGALVKASRLEAGIVAVSPKMDAVQALLDEVFSQIMPKAGAKGITVLSEPTVCTAFFDRKWTAEALFNILDNGVKYSPEKSTITVRAIPYELFCRIDVTDQGIGIAEEERGKIFARFYRSNAVRDEEGVGIGLYLSREIVSAGGGYLKVSSRLGQGATFSVFLLAEKR